MLNDDGQMFEVNEKHTPNGMKWSDMAGENITMKMEFWWNVTHHAECKIAKIKALVSTLKYYLEYLKIFFPAFFY